ncbi:cytochrome P450 [Coniella lustricola]|uniref:Cytochrome P450 n=1 Tax=Coniella lustricola TaxID=2025994 RepID=A0A2T3A6H3_9PEZI|nr:cytochrome P450 [Coniella lustricola]
MALDSIWDVAFGNELNTLPEEITFLRNLPSTAISIPTTTPKTNNAAINADTANYLSITFPKPSYNISVRSMLIITDGLDMAATSPFPRQAHWLLRQTPRYRHARAYKTRLIQERIADAKRRVLSAIPSFSPNDDNEGGGRRTRRRKRSGTNDTSTITASSSEFHGITCATDHLVRRETLAARKENRAPAYDSPEAKDELFGFLVGGHDTTATTMMWAIKFLADHPRVQNKLRHVLRTEAFPSFASSSSSSSSSSDSSCTPKIPTSAAITSRTNLPYLDAVVEEIFRCAGTAASAVRQATRDTTLLGYSIPKGTDVYFMSNGPGYIQSNALNALITEDQRSASSREYRERALPAWDEEDISAFRPERWLKTTTVKTKTAVDDGGGDRETNEEKETTTMVFDVRSGPVLQFGGGLRGCFGKRMAYLEMRILVVLLVWMYELVQVPEGLGGNAAFDSLTHKPKNCYLVLQELKY